MGRTSLLIRNCFPGGGGQHSHYGGHSTCRETDRRTRPESLLIGGWRPMWRPLEIFLYDWWPIRAERTLLREVEHDAGPDHIQRRPPPEVRSMNQHETATSTIAAIRDRSAEGDGTKVGPEPLSSEELRRIDAYWRAANYLSVGQIYLLDNPLLREPLTLEHVKPRLLGHWGTTPGLNFIYVHMNRVIKRDDLDAIYIAGPGHGGPGVVANTYLEGTYSEIYPDISQDEEGLRKLFRQFSFPGGIPSHASPETPGSINEGGELGYSLLHAYGAAFDNPDLMVCCVIGDGEAETGPLRHQLAFEQIPQSGARRRGVADSPS